MTQKNQDCYFYYYSSCSKGSDCPFRHESSALGNEIVCSFWKMGTCMKTNCCFRHMDIKKNRNEIPCYWELQPGGCLKSHCPFYHISEKNDENVSNDNKKDLHLDLREKLIKKEDQIITKHVLNNEDKERYHANSPQMILNGIEEELKIDNIDKNVYNELTDGKNSLQVKHRWTNKRKTIHHIQNELPRTKVRICRKGITASNLSSPDIFPEEKCITVSNDFPYSIENEDTDDESLQSQKILHEIDCLLQSNNY